MKGSRRSRRRARVKQKDAASSWLATYRLLSKGIPCTPEVAIKMAQLSEFDRSEDTAVVSNENDYDGLVEEVRRTSQCEERRQRRTPGTWYGQGEPRR